MSLNNKTSTLICYTNAFILFAATLMLPFLAGCLPNTCQHNYHTNPVPRSVNPQVLLGGTSGATLKFAIPEKLAPDDKLFLSGNAGKIDLTLNRYTGCCRAVFSTGKIPPVTAEYSLLLQKKNGEASIIKKNAVKVIQQFHIALTFDDGPSVDGNPDDGAIYNSPTIKVLNFLDNFRHGPGNSLQGIKAAFFVLTTPDHFLYDKYFKAETVDGEKILRETSRRGHLIGCHWGGEYYGQTKLHCRRVMLPPYDSTKSGMTQGDNALESDLTECISKIRDVTGQTPRFVRPTLWKYRNPKNPQSEKLTLETYKRLGLTMALSDAKYPDGGYAIISIVSPFELSKFREFLRKAFLSGEDRLVFSMHDSNSQTAKRMPEIFSAIAEEFDKLRFNGTCGKAGERLVYARTSAEVADILHSKTHFVMFPKYDRNTAGR